MCFRMQAAIRHLQHLLSRLLSPPGGRGLRPRQLLPPGLRGPPRGRGRARAPRLPLVGPGPVFGPGGGPWPPSRAPPYGRPRAAVRAGRSAAAASANSGSPKVDGGPRARDGAAGVNARGCGRVYLHERSLSARLRCCLHAAQRHGRFGAVAAATSRPLLASAEPLQGAGCTAALSSATGSA